MASRSLRFARRAQPNRAMYTRKTSLRAALLIVGLASSFSAPSEAKAQALAQPQSPVPSPQSPRANWLLANRYSTPGLRNVVFTAAVQPRWLGKTDSLWYFWKNKTGARFFLVVPTCAVLTFEAVSVTRPDWSGAAR